MLTANFLTAKGKAKALEKHLQILKGNNSSSEILEPPKVLLKSNDENAERYYTNNFSMKGHSLELR